MTGKIIIAICVAFVLLITFASLTVSSRWSRKEEEDDG